MYTMENHDELYIDYLSILALRRLLLTQLKVREFSDDSIFKDPCLSYQVYTFMIMLWASLIDSLHPADDCYCET